MGPLVFVDLNDDIGEVRLVRIICFVDLNKAQYKIPVHLPWDLSCRCLNTMFGVALGIKKHYSLIICEYNVP